MFLLGVLIGVWVSLGVEVASASGGVAPVETHVIDQEDYQQVEETRYCTTECEYREEVARVLYCNQQVGEGCAMVKSNSCQIID